MNGETTWVDIVFLSVYIHPIRIMYVGKIDMVTVNVFDASVAHRCMIVSMTVSVILRHSLILWNTVVVLEHDHRMESFH